jgi:nickel/cobalt transporter (NicO) family protein
MGSLTELLQPGAAAGWLLLPSALALGVFHGLEPGHSKTMMTAFIIAVRGTVAQAVLLGLAATVSHTSVVWLVALIGLHLGSRYDSAVAEPYFQIASAVLIIAVALWILWRTWFQRTAVHHHAHRDGNGQHSEDLDPHERAHADEVRRRFGSGNVTTGQIVMFGLSGGLIPCSAAIAVLVLCLQVNQIWLGVALVLCFSIGLAITLIAAGMTAAIGMRHLSRR